MGASRSTGSTGREAHAVAGHFQRAAAFEGLAAPVADVDAARLATPALVVDLDRVRSNVACMIALLDGDVARWRPHVKTTKSTRLWSTLLDAGVRHFKCATVREAESLLDLADRRGESIDLLVAYPHQGPAVERIAALARTFAPSRVSATVEDLEDVERWPREVGLFVDLNTGLDRTGLASADRSRALEIARAAGSRLRGLHVYDGHHLADGPARERAAHAGYREVLAVFADLAARGVHADEIVTSGTPAFPAALRFDGFEELDGVVHRVSPGTIVLFDARAQEQIPDLGFAPAALVLSRVVSRPRRGRVTCDAGSKGVSAEAGSPVAVPIGWPRLVAASPSEEHLPLDAAADAPDELPAKGAFVWLVPRHVCTTVNLYDDFVVVEGGRVVGSAAVDARGHRVTWTP